MGLERIRRVSSVIPVTPRRIYDAWLNSDEHSAFTGSPAQITPRKGAQFTAHDGYIQGSNLDLDRGTRIVQSWRTSDFPADAEDSQLEITFIQSETGTRIVINHGGIPEGQGERYHVGWGERYFKPMSRYFLSRRDSPEVLARAARRAESNEETDGNSSSLGTLISARQYRPQPEAPAPAEVADDAPSDEPEQAESGSRRRAPPQEAPRGARKRSPPSAPPATAARVARAPKTEPAATRTSKPVGRKAPTAAASVEGKAKTRKPVRRKGAK